MDPSGAGKRVVAKREKSSRTYRYSSYNYVEILGSTQGSVAPGILQPAASPSPAKIDESESSARRHRYNFRDESDAEDGD